MMPDSFDFIGRFKSPKSQRQFIRYCIEHQSKFCFVTISALIFSWAIAMSLLGAVFVEKGDPTYHDSLQGYGITTLILGILGVVCSLLTCFPCLNTKDRYIILSYLQVSVIAFMDLIFIIKSIQKLHLGSPDCTSGVSDQSDITAVNQATAHSPSSLLIKSLPACPSDNSFASLFANRVILAISLCPQLLMAIVHEPRLYFILISQLATGAIVAASMYTSVYSILPYSILSIVTVFLVTELHFQRIRSFITQRKLQQLLEQIERDADENHATEMRHMIGNVAHDLKTPLASFTNGLDIINDILMKAKAKAAGNAMTSETFAECFASIQSCIVNIQNTNAFMLMRINRCIDYTKASKGIKLVPKFETVDLHEALQFPIDCMRNIQERIEIKLEPLPEGTCSHIITDKQWLQENILCLLSNAVKYSTEGEVKISTTLIREPLQNNISDEFSRASTGNLSKIIPTNFEEPDTSYLLFEIEDTGIGLSEEAIKSLFNPFKQAQRLAGGTGLGLYSLAKRMKALHGSYGVRKRKDGKQGSLFWFTVPYKPDLTSFTAAKDTTTLFEQSADTTYSSRQCSDKKLLDILIVDDSPSILKTSSFMLKRQGHKIWTAENGEIALKRIEEKWRESGKGFDLVLMDLQMPVMDGLEATRRLRMMEAEGRDWMSNNDPTPQDDRKYEYQAKVKHHQIIIGLSANSDHETANDAIRAGADDFFGKPFSLNTFNKMIERYF